MNHRVSVAHAVLGRRPFHGIPGDNPDPGRDIGAGVPAEHGERVAVAAKVFQKTPANQPAGSRNGDVHALNSLPVRSTYSISRIYASTSVFRSLPERTIERMVDRKSTRLNSSHLGISYA